MEISLRRTHLHLLLGSIGLCWSLSAPGQTSTPASLAPAPAVTGPAWFTQSDVVVHDLAETTMASVPHLEVAPADVLSSAGTFGDFEKYLATLPGVVFNSDESDDVLVRGGNPVENLYLVDGFEVPDINHITGLGTTGGFTSMIDTASVAKLDLLSGGYSANYSERLSSVIAITTLGQEPSSQQPSLLEAGYVGFGGHQVLRLGSDSRLLLDVHRSILNSVTNDVGLDGVPVYTNGLASGQFVLGARNSISILSLTGADGIHITPTALNPVESSTIQTQYAGWRTTNGLRWNHAFGTAATTALTLSDSEDSETIAQQNQAPSPSVDTPYENANVPVYREQTHDGISIVQYEVMSPVATWLSVDAGAQGRLDRVQENIAQPAGAQSPYSTSPASHDDTSFAPDFMAGQSGTWLELTAAPTGALSFTIGGRVQTFATGGQHTTATPRARATYTLGEHHSLYAAFGEYAQQPDFVYLESYAQNRTLLPIFDRQFVLGSDLYRDHALRITAEAYSKHYWNYPVSTEYAQVSLANMVDMLGQQCVWLPLASRGRGRDYGLDLNGEVHLGRTLFLEANAAWARAFYSAEDNIYRPGNFDFPVVANTMLIWRSPSHYEASARFEYTTGRPYTPYLLETSIAQDRPIYDVTRMNAERGPAYARLDLQAARTFHPGNTLLYVYAGIENAFDRNNFLGNAWTPRCDLYPQCVAENGAYTAVSQIGLYPNLGLRFFF